MNLPKAAWQQGFKNAFFTLLIILFVTGVIALIAILGFRQSVGNGFLIAFAVIWVMVYFFFVFAWFKNRRQAGQVVLDIMPFPNRALSFILGVLFIVLGFLGTYQFTAINTSNSRLISSVIGVSIGTYQIFMGFSRLQIRENGILAYVDLVKWNKIESFDWVHNGGKMSTLKLRYKGRLPAFLRNGALPVPIEKKGKLESLLELYLPDKALAEKRA